jgi:hypothetical protein
MAESSGKKGSDGSEQHPYVERVRPDPSKLPRPVVTLTGLLGRSDRDGHQRLYFTRDLGTYAEFLSADVLFVEQVPAAQSPIQGIDASRITLSQDATVHYTRSTKATELDEFDLSLRTAPAAESFAGPRRITPLCVPTDQGPCATDTCRTYCGQETCDTCRTCEQATCHTCRTQCGQATCETCQTCHTQCGTCQTCETRCGTCATCGTCFTCGHDCNTVASCSPQCTVR